MSSSSAPSSCKKSPRPVGRPNKLTNVRRNNIAALYGALHRRAGGVPLVSITNTLSGDAGGAVDEHLKIKRRWRKILPQWRQLDAVEKELVRQFALHRTTSASAFTLNLGHRLAASLTYGSTDSRDVLRDRIARALREDFGNDVPFTMIMEVTGAGRLHVHGTAAVGGDHPRLEQCLGRAGGDWVHKHGGSYQAKADDLYGPEGWTSYVTKLLKRTIPFKPMHVMARSRSADHLAMALYEEMLAFLEDHDDEVTPVRVGYAGTDEDELALLASFFRRN